MSVSVASIASPYPDFFQEGPRLGNAYTEDSFMMATVRRYLSKDEEGRKLLATASDELTKFGHRVHTDLRKLNDEMEEKLPYLVQYDGWGNRIDQLVTCDAWRKMHGVAAEEGLVALAYERPYAYYSRFVQMIKLCLFAPSSGLYNCPLAMTDGAARLLEILLGQMAKGEASASHQQLPIYQSEMKNAFARVTSRIPDQFWTSGQWMTERGGGSDVAAGTRTVARLQCDGTYKLFGFKWFTSATDSSMTITLARIEDASGKTVHGTKGLSCFFLRIRDDNGALNNIRIHRLKNKLGTKQVPTAELELLGTTAVLISEPGRGVATIVNLINVTRLYNAVSAVGGMRRMVNLNRDYASRRVVFGRALTDHLVHMETLASMEVNTRAAASLVFELALRMGKIESGVGSKEDAVVVRLLTPLAKLYTGKQAVAVASEGLEAFGGAGYMEETRLPRLLRDAQVLPIWEGTTNVLAHDVTRVLAATKKETITTFHQVVSTRLSAASVALPLMKFDTIESTVARFEPVLTEVASSLRQLDSFLTACAGNDTHRLEQRSRDLAFALSRVYMASILIEHACSTSELLDWLVCERWVLENDTCVHTTASLVGRSLTLTYSVPQRVFETKLIALDIDKSTKLSTASGNKTTDGTVRSRL